MSLYERVAAKSGGGRALAAARLRKSVLLIIHRAFMASGLDSQSELAKRLRVRRSAVNQVFRGDGNVRVDTLAEYVYEMGFEVSLTLVRAGELRAANLENRQPESAFPSWGASASVTFATDQIASTGWLWQSNLMLIDANLHSALSGLNLILSTNKPAIFSLSSASLTNESINMSGSLASLGAAP